MRWTLISAATALAVTAFVLVVVTYPEHYKIWLTVGLFGGVFAFMFLRNPTYRYMRLAWWIAAAWATATAVPEFKAAFLFRDETAGTVGFGNQLGGAFHVAFAVAFLGCIVLDYLASRDNSAIRLFLRPVHIRFGGQRQTVSGGTAIQVGDVSGQATVNVHQIDVNRELDYAKALLDKGMPDAAEEHLLRVRHDHDLAFNPQQRFRVESYFGQVFHDRGEASKAAIHFKNASTLRPDDELGQAYGALSKFMAGQTMDAYHAAIDILRKHPGSSLAAAVMIRSAPPKIKAAALLPGIDESVKSDLDILVAFAIRFLSEDETTIAEEYLRQVLAKRAGHPFVSGHLGSAITIAEAYSAARRFREGPLAESSRKRFEEGIGLLTLATESSQCPQDVRQFKSMRGLARELLGDLVAAEADYVAAVEGDRICQDTTTRYAAFLVRQDRITDALTTLRPAIGHAKVVDPLAMFGFLALEAGTDSDKKEALARLSHNKEMIAAAPSQQRNEVLRLMALLTNDLHGNAAALAFLDEQPSGVFSDAASWATKAIIHLKAGDHAAANAAATNAQQALTDEGSLPLRSQLARIMGQLERFSDVLAILRPVATAENFEVVGRYALDAARRCGADDFVMAYTRMLREANCWDAYAVELEVETLRRYREHDRAVSVCREFIQRTTNEADRRYTRLRLSLIGLESGQSELVERDPDQLPRVDEVSPQVVQLLCAVLEQCSVPIRAIETAYEFVRRHYQSHEAHLALCAAVGIGRPERDILPEPDVVAPGVAVRVRIDGDEAARWLILEDGANPDPTRQEYPLDHPLCRELDGKRPADQFVDRANPYQERHGVIEEVRSKFRFRAWDSVNRWMELFPHVPFVFMFKLNRPEDDRPDFAPILRAIEAQDRNQEAIREWYKSNPVSILVMSAMLHRHPSQVIPYLATHPDLPIRCCQGTLDEYDIGRDGARAATLVADPSALSTVFVTGLWRHVNRFPFKLITTRSAIDEFLRLAEEERNSSGERLWRHGDELVRLTTPTDEREQLIRSYEEFVNWLRSFAEIRSGVALASVSQKRRQELITLFGQAAAEAIAVALQEQMPIWTDDMTVPVAMHEAQPALRTWTQLVAERLRDEQCLTGNHFAELLALLIAYRFQHTQCMPEALLWAAERSGWNPDHRPLADVLKWLGNENINAEGVFGVAVGGLRLIWHSAALAHQREGVTEAIGRAIAQRPGGRPLVLSVAAIAERLFPLEPHLVAQCRTMLLRSVEDTGGDDAPG